MKRQLPAVFASLAALAAPAAQAQVTATFNELKVEAGQHLYQSVCRRCHAPDADHATYGPPLENVVGRKAGSYPGYAYSPALKGANFVWTDGALRAWMEDNTEFVPGTKMRHVGIADQTVQDFILAYLRSISPKAPKPAP